MIPNHTPLKLIFLVRSLDYGGAQRQLISLAKTLDKNLFSVSVVAFYPGPLDQELTGSGIPLSSLNKRGRWDILGFLWRLLRQVRVAQPDILHGYLDLPNVLALFLKLLIRTRVVWGLRASTIDVQHYDWLHRLAAKAERWFARWADLIIINSASGWEQHVARGFPRASMIVIPNGFDTELFKPDREAGAKLRRQWGVPAATKLIGIVGRLDPMKDHQNFLQAAAIVVSHSADAALTSATSEAAGPCFVCVGDGPAGYREQLKLLARELGLGEKLIWQDAATEVVAVYNALDVLVSASRAEGLPNVVGEAMACGVPCVVTDVGDARLLVGDCGIVVPPQNSAALAEGIIRCLTSGGTAGGARSRARIVEHYGPQRLATQTEKALMALALGD